MPTRDWRPTAAYLYLLHLDPIGLAWEYLRRNPTFCCECTESAGYRFDETKRWGCHVVEDPSLDARYVQPQWVPRPPAQVKLEGDAAGDTSWSFSLWAIPGAKTLQHDGYNLTLTAQVQQQTIRLTLGSSVQDGQPFAFALPAHADPRDSWPSISIIRDLFDPAKPVRPTPLERPDRQSILHMRTLQALDGESAGASHREIAEVIFGEDDVFQRWATDSELRAHIRYLLRRGRKLMNEGYRPLLGTNRRQA